MQNGLSGSNERDATNSIHFRLAYPIRMREWILHGLANIGANEFGNGAAFAPFNLVRSSSCDFGLSLSDGDND